MASDIRIGILGTGGIAGTHAKNLERIPGVRIVALCNRHLEKAEKFNQRHGGGAKCFDNFQKMLEEVEMDALYVCMPPGCHNGEVEAAAARGIHLFLEKPIALDLARAQSMADAVKSSGVKCQIGHHLRASEPVRKLKQMIRDGSAGRPLLMQARWFCNSLYGDWWRDPEIGGGQLIEQAIHIYDLTRYFFGDVDVVTGFRGNLGHARFPQYRVDDTSASTIRFRNGAIASICASNAAEPCAWSVCATVIFEKVVVDLATPERATFVYHDGKVSDEVWRDNIKIPREEVANTVNAHEQITRNFIAAVRGEEEMLSSIDDGLEGLRLVRAVARSSDEDGMPQRL